MKSRVDEAPQMLMLIKRVFSMFFHLSSNALTKSPDNIHQPPPLLSINFMP
jgi:hypothetical protein